MTEENPNEFESLRKLMGLKRHETPGDDFTERFVEQFWERQRVASMELSVRDLARERLALWWGNHFGTTQRRWAAAGVAALVAVSLLGMASSRNSLDGAGNGGLQASVVDDDQDLFPHLMVEAVWNGGQDSLEQHEVVSTLESGFGRGYTEEAKKKSVARVARDLREQWQRPVRQ
jgi:hypothetical protein